MKYCTCHFVTSGEVLWGHLYRTKFRNDENQKRQQGCVFSEGKWQLKHCRFRNCVLFLHWDDSVVITVT